MQSFGRAALETGRGPMATLAGVALLGFAAGVAASLSKRAATEVAISAVDDWVEALAMEHRQIEDLFEQLLSAGETEGLKRSKLFRKLDRTLSRHAFAEEQVVYPTLAEHGAEADARRLSSDHFDHRALLHAIDALDRNDPSWREAVRKLYKAFATHAHDEDHTVYPDLRARLSPEDNARLHRDLAKRSRALPEPRSGFQTLISMMEPGRSHLWPGGEDFTSCSTLWLGADVGARAFKVSVARIWEGAWIGVASWAAGADLAASKNAL